MGIYSKEDQFSRGVALITFLPLSIPHYILEGGESLFISFILMFIFFWMLITDMPTFRKLYACGEKWFVLVIFITILSNLIFSFYIKEFGNYLWANAAWCFLVSMSASKKIRINGESMGADSIEKKQK